jgi:hypothetical protein
MQTFHGTLQSTITGESPLKVSLQFDGDRIRMWSDRHRIGSWNASDVKIQRETIFRFVLSIDGESYRFTPDDPGEFANSVDVELDLTTAERPRFGLAQRIRQAQAT